MRVSSISAAVAFFVALVASQRLNKPALQPDLDNLKQGLLDNLHPVHSTRDRFKAGYIPSDCKRIAQGEGLNPADIQVWNIHYDDVSPLLPCLLPCRDQDTDYKTQCSTPWIVCYHKNSFASLDSLVDRFGRVPVHTRQWVRHLITIPKNGGATMTTPPSPSSATPRQTSTSTSTRPHTHSTSRAPTKTSPYPPAPTGSTTTTKTQTCRTGTRRRTRSRTWRRIPWSRPMNATCLVASGE